MTLVLSDRHVKAMKHCIGMDVNNRPYKRHGKLFYKLYRNFYATGPACDGVDIWLDLERHGYAIHGFGAFRWTFALTRFGLDALGLHLDVRIKDE